ncbi:hypothetical protein YC2023_065738 [Brassica napus]
MAAFTVDFQLCFIAILVWLFSCFCLSAFFFKKRKEPELQDCNLPPSPPSVPVIGHLHLLLSVPVHKSFQKLSSKYAQLFWSHRAPWPNEVLKIQDLNFATRTRQDPIMENSKYFLDLLALSQLLMEITGGS